MDILEQLRKSRSKQRKAEDEVLAAAQEILQKDLFKDEKVLENLRQYNRSFDVLNEDDIDALNCYTVSEIKEVAVQQRLKFLDSSDYKNEIPYAAVLMIKDLNRIHAKDLKAFKILALADDFRNEKQNGTCSLFVKTNMGKYALLHQWGPSLSSARQWRYWPLRTFENLVISLLVFTLIVTLSLPTFLITLDSHAEYWSGYRGGTFFHLMFFFTGFTAFTLFAFGINFSSSIWDRRRDF
jgi:hypothetical protein